MSDIVERLTNAADWAIAENDHFEPELGREAATEITRLRAKLQEAVEVVQYVVSESTAAIAGEPKHPSFTSHDDVPNGLRTHAHIKLAMIRESAAAFLASLETEKAPDGAKEG